MRSVRVGPCQGSLLLLCLFPEFFFTGQQDGSVKPVRQTTMPATDLHGDDDEFADDGELRAKRGIDPFGPHAQAHGTIGADNLKQDIEQRESAIHNFGSLADGDDEETQEDIP